MAEEGEKDAVGNLGLSGYIKVYPESRSVGTVVKKSSEGVPNTTAANDLTPTVKESDR